MPSSTWLAARFLMPVTLLADVSTDLVAGVVKPIVGFREFITGDGERMRCRSWPLAAVPTDTAAVARSDLPSR
jgi:hypothetical protein